MKIQITYQTTMWRPISSDSCRLFIGRECMMLTVSDDEYTVKCTYCGILNDLSRTHHVVVEMMCDDIYLHTVP